MPGDLGLCFACLALSSRLDGRITLAYASRGLLRMFALYQSSDHGLLALGVRLL